MVIGPYLTKEMSKQQFLEQAEHSSIDPRQVRHLVKYYSMVPYIPEHSHAFVFLETFFDLLWTDFRFFDVSDQLSHALSPITTEKAPARAEKTSWNIDLIEDRYASENMLLEAVASGQPHKGELLLAAFHSLPFERRVDDPIRNLKNYGIIMNTLLRKAAEKGGVHPIYLDSASSDFAHRIEHHNSTASLEVLMKEVATNRNVIRVFPPERSVK